MIKIFAHNQAPNRLLRVLSWFDNYKATRFASADTLAKLRVWTLQKC